ncbi:MAG: hemolysin III family protein [Bdellovibrio sp.]|nr:hemolysin III family protein [Bdellovibrio sp.]
MYKGEKFNSISHLIGVILACVGVSFLISSSIDKGDVYKIIAFSIYGAILIGLYIVSTIYHSIKGPWKNVLRQMDYLSIYVMIAGSYTPFTLVTLRGVWGWSLFAIIWTLALAGIIQEIYLGKKTRRYSLIIYLLMGWLIVVAMKPLISSLAPAGLWWLIAGGLSYTVGVIFFVMDEKVRHFHGVWHLFVMGGSICQFVCLYLYVA